MLFLSRKALYNTFLSDSTADCHRPTGSGPTGLDGGKDADLLAELYCTAGLQVLEVF
jgi:hypothetical protein